MPPQILGICWIIVSGLAFVVVTGLVRYMGTDLPAIQAAFIRYSFGLILIFPFVARLYQRKYVNRSITIKPKRINLTRIYFYRGLIHAAAVGCWFYAMARLPVALVTAIGFLTPISITIAATLFMGETLKLRRIISVIIAFVGALIILAPEFGRFNLVIIIQLLAAQCFAISYLLAKVLSNHASSEEVVAMLTFYCTLALAPVAVYLWQTPNHTELFLLALTAVAATIGHYALSEAVKNAPLTLLQPFTFLQLIWATLMGILLFAENPAANLFIGGALIIASTTYITHREIVLRNQENS